MAQDAGPDSLRPRIGVTGAVERFSPSWYAIRLSVALVGGAPVRINVNRCTPPEQLHGVIVSGGDDIHPGLYGSDALADKEYDHERDELEETYIRYALKERLPLMGICRGYQLINVVMGGSLHVDIRKMRQHTSNFGTFLPRKTALLERDSLVSQLTGRHRLRINSLHYQAVDRVAAELRVTGRDLDDFVQALEHREAPILGVQWHPEYLFYMPSHIRLFRWLVSQARLKANTSPP